ncbi:EutP/PduV family microcompartment system protein [Proteinivorax hydrogeniformans]|uniref:EutP/PduV family microcompartment system protein n=1 Tax=Proteinivorax hydrogeniformans TaxID=1826727 RepID=A0AAU8HUA1_9FIRM
MRKKRIMVVGPRKSGKTTLVNALNDYKGPLRRTQDVIYGEKTIDVPSSYIENARMYKYIIAMSQDASHLILLIDQSNCQNIYPPGFAKPFKCPVIGVITKSDLQPENESLCYKQFEQIGVKKPYFKISSPDCNSIEELKQHLFNKERKGEHYEVYNRKET